MYLWRNAGGGRETVHQSTLELEGMMGQQEHKEYLVQMVFR